MMTPSQAKFVLSLIVTAVLAVIVVLGFQQISEWRAGAAQNEARKGVQQAAEPINQQGIKDDAQRDEQDVDTGTAREQFNTNQDEAERHDVPTATRAATAVPDRVRNNFRARRLQRERSGCVRAECTSGREAEDAAER